MIPDNQRDTSIISNNDINYPCDCESTQNYFAVKATIDCESQDIEDKYDNYDVTDNSNVNAWRMKIC